MRYIPVFPTQLSQLLLINVHYYVSIFTKETQIIFCFFPKTKIPIVVASLLVPLSGWLHLGVLDFLPMDWLERPLEFQPDYVFFSRTLVLLSFFGIVAKWSANERIREISFSLFIPKRVKKSQAR